MKPHKKDIIITQMAIIIGIIVIIAIIYFIIPKPANDFTINVVKSSNMTVSNVSNACNYVFNQTCLSLKGVFNG